MIEITEVRIMLPSKTKDSRVLAYAAVIFNNVFVVNDIRLIQTPNGTLVAMPDKESTYNCNQCYAKLPLRARFCLKCGASTEPDETDMAQKRYMDVAHPLTSEFRDYITKAVIDAYHQQSSH